MDSEITILEADDAIKRARCGMCYTLDALGLIGCNLAF